MAKKNHSPSDRELQVLQLIADGLTDEQIGHHISLSKNTVSIHRKKLLHKMQVSNVAMLVAVAFRKGLIK